MNSSEKNFLLLIDKHKGIIHKLSKLYMGNAEDREDLSQEIILQLWKNFSSFRSESHFSTWMYRVSLNTAISFYKKDKRKTAAINSSAQVLETTVISNSQNNDTRLEQFYKAAQSLNPIEKAIIFLFMEGLTHRQISEKLGISVINVRVKLNRTKGKLQQLIKQQQHEF